MAYDSMMVRYIKKLKGYSLRELTEKEIEKTMSHMRLVAINPVDKNIICRINFKFMCLEELKYKMMFYQRKNLMQTVCGEAHKFLELLA